MGRLQTELFQPHRVTAVGGVSEITRHVPRPLIIGANPSCSDGEFGDDSHQRRGLIEKLYVIQENDAFAKSRKPKQIRRGSTQVVRFASRLDDLQHAGRQIAAPRGDDPKEMLRRG